MQKNLLKLSKKLEISSSYVIIYKIKFGILMYYTVYKTTCLVNNKIYIGKHQTKNLNDGYLGSGKSLLRAVNKYGKDNFKVERILLNSEKEMNELEAFIVDEEFVSRKDTYNITLGGYGGFFYINSSGIDKFKGKRHSEKAKQKIALASTGKKHSYETKQKILKNNNLQCPIRREKISQSLKKMYSFKNYNGNKLSKEHREKISKSLINNKKSSYSIEDMNLLNLWHPTKNLSLNPFDLTCNQNTKIWWLCKNNHSYKKTIRAQIKCNRCPKCVSLGYKYPNIAKLWHKSKNENLTPFDVFCRTSKKVWWICEKGHEYEQRINDKTYKGYGCPKCSGRK
jgi:hypothetical protein